MYTYFRVLMLIIYNLIVYYKYTNKVFHAAHAMTSKSIEST